MELVINFVRRENATRSIVAIILLRLDIAFTVRYHSSQSVLSSQISEAVCDGLY